MKKIIFASVLGLSGNVMAAETVNITLLGTSDLHGTFVPRDYASDTENLAGSLSQIATQVKKVRAEQPNLIWWTPATPFKATSSKPSSMRPSAR